MGTPKSDQKRPDGLIDGFSPTSPTKIFWNSRKRTANGQSLDQVMEESLKEGSKTDDPVGATEKMEDTTPVLSDRRKALFEPLEPTNISNERRLRPSAETLLPPPDFDDASYPRGWLVGKKRKLVNVDVVESMRRIAVQEMNRKVLSFSPQPLMTTHTKMHTDPMLLIRWDLLCNSIRLISSSGGPHMKTWIFPYEFVLPVPRLKITSIRAPHVEMVR